MWCTWSLKLTDSIEFVFECRCDLTRFWADQFWDIWDFCDFGNCPSMKSSDKIVSKQKFIRSIIFVTLWRVDWYADCLIWTIFILFFWFAAGSRTNFKCSIDYLSWTDWVSTSLHKPFRLTQLHQFNEYPNKNQVYISIENNTFIDNTPIVWFFLYITHCGQIDPQNSKSDCKLTD